jgi:hypothetical protein
MLPAAGSLFQDWKSRRINYVKLMSVSTQALIEKIKTAPEGVQREVYHYLIFLKSRLKAQAEGAENLLPLAQSAWAADWNRPEEDEAWRDL